MVAIKVVVVLALLIAMAVVVLRVRKILRDRERRESNEPPRLVTPPPSPYVSSKGFRLLNGDGTPAPRPLPNRPRLDPDRQYVFGDQPVAGGDEAMPSGSRHDEEWLLHRSSHRSSLPSAGVIGVLVVIVLIIASLVIFFRHHSAPSRPTTTSTTSLSIAASGRGGFAVTPSRVAWSMAPVATR